MPPNPPTRRLSRLRASSSEQDPDLAPASREATAAPADVSIGGSGALSRSTGAGVAASTAGGDRGAVDLAHPELPYSTLTFLALLGAMETAYLTYEKLYGGPLTCPFGGSCSDVLDSSYGTLLGLPLSLYGFLSYSSVALLTTISRTTARRGIGKDNVRWFQLGLTTAMAGVSAFLLYIIKFELDSAFCAYCLFSAGLSGTLLLLTLKGFTGDEIKRALAPQAGLVLATLLGLHVAFGDPRSALAGVQEIDLPPLEPEVTTVSTPLEVRLAKHLASAGARMYGAFWCSHCYEQKQAFGQEAAKLLPYVECYPEGYRRGVKLAQACEDAKIEGFPTWVINGELRPGEQELSELARLTGFDPSKGGR